MGTCTCMVPSCANLSMENSKGSSCRPRTKYLESGGGIYMLMTSLPYWTHGKPSLQVFIQNLNHQKQSIMTSLQTYMTSKTNCYDIFANLHDSKNKLLWHLCQVGPMANHFYESSSRSLIVTTPPSFTDHKVSRRSHPPRYKGPPEGWPGRYWPACQAHGHTSVPPNGYIAKLWSLIAKRCSTHTSSWRRPL